MFKKLVLKVFLNGISPESGLRDKSRSAVFNSISIFGFFILIYFTIVDIKNNDFLVASITGSTSLLIIFCILIVGLTKKINIGTTFITILSFLLFLMILYTQNTERAGYFWIMLFPLISIFFMGLLAGSIVTFIFGIIAALLMFKIPSVHNLPLINGMAERAIGAYIGVTLFTAAFEFIRYKAFTDLEATSIDLVEKRRQTTMILNNVKQGIFLLNEQLILEEEKSSYFSKLFGNIEPNTTFIDLIKDKLPQRDFIATKDYLELFFNKTVNPALLSSINPIDKIMMNFNINETESSQLWLEFSFERIELINGEIQILGLFKDVTDQVLLEEQLQKEESESLENMENLFQIIHINPELMDEFLKDTNDEIGKINDLLKVESNDTQKIINFVFAVIHGIKGNAMLLGLNSLATKLKDFEDYIKELQITNPTWRELLKLTVNLAELKHDIDKITELIDKIINFQSKVGDSIQNRKYIFSESLKKSLSRLSKEYNKDVILNLDEYNIDLIPEKYRRLLKDSINQFIRNSIAHGIENKDERIQKSKNPIGTITIALSKVDDKLHLTYRDDGQGLNINKIKDVAINKKGFEKTYIDNLSNQDVVKLIFHPGFSTTDKIDNLSGQGIGMSVIKNHIDKVGGKLNIKSSIGKFCEFRIVLQE